jgi:hypothetical protein
MVLRGSADLSGAADKAKLSEDSVTVGAVFFFAQGNSSRPKVFRMKHARTTANTILSSVRELSVSVEIKLQSSR